MITIEPRDAGCCDHCYRNTAEVPIVHIAAGVPVQLCPACLADLRRLLAALPPAPAPTGERRPCGAWEEFSPSHFVLVVDGVPRFHVVLRATDLCWWWAADGRNPVVAASCETAQLAAEDAAAELLRAGLRALGWAK